MSFVFLFDEKMPHLCLKGLSSEMGLTEVASIDRSFLKGEEAEIQVICLSSLMRETFQDSAPRLRGLGNQQDNWHQT